MCCYAKAGPTPFAAFNQEGLFLVWRGTGELVSTCASLGTLPCVSRTKNEKRLSQTVSNSQSITLGIPRVSKKHDSVEPFAKGNQIFLSRIEPITIESTLCRKNAPPKASIGQNPKRPYGRNHCTKTCL